MNEIISERLDKLGRYFVFLGQLIKCSFKRPFYVYQYFYEIERIGVNSLFIIILSAGAMGMIFALQMVTMLQKFSAEISTGAMVAVAMSREIAPVVTTLMLIAKNGSAMAAELGTMKVTEQIDALEAMSITPERYLVLPKVAASMIVFPMLTLLANVVGSLGSYIVSVNFFGIEAGSYLDYLFTFLYPVDIFMGLIKAFIMGIIVSTICCFYGLNATQGAKGVGDSATGAVVASSVSILIADYILTTLLLRVIYI